MKSDKKALPRVVGAVLVLAAALHAATAPAGYFERNVGQARSSEAPFLARTSSGPANVQPDQLTLRSNAGGLIGIELEKADPHAAGEGVDRLPGVSHYALDRDPSKWIYGVQHFSGVLYRDIYRGVDLRYHISRGNLEFDLEAERPSRVSNIRLRFTKDVRLTATGDLDCGDGSIRRPEAWQTIGGKRRPIAVSYRIVGRRRVAFDIAAIDSKAAVVIDPMIDFATYLGGSNVETDTQMVVDTAGNIYMAGTTYSADFPASVQPGSPLNAAIYLRDPDIYVTRLRPDASAIDWSFFIGGTAFERCAALAQDALGDIYVFGTTSSVNFPVTPGAFKTSVGASLTNEFAVKLDEQTGRIEASTYLPLAGSTNSLSLIASGPFAVDFTGGVYAAGFGGADFQPTPNAYIGKQPNTYQPSGIVRLNSSLTAAIYETWFDTGGGNLQPDANGNLFIVGGTSNTTAVLSELNPSGTAVIFTTQIGSGITDLQIDQAGNVWMAGYSISGGFPSANSLQIDPAPSNYSPAWYQMYPFFAELPPGGKNPLQATLFYGPNFEVQPAFGTTLIKLLKPGGRLCLTGLPGSTQTAGGIVSAQGNGSTSLACVDDTGTRIGMRTALPQTDVYSAAAATPDGAVLFAGQTYGNLPATSGVVQPAYAGSATYNSYSVNGGDAFLLRVSLLNPLPAIRTVSPDSVYITQPNNPNTGGGWNFGITGSGFGYGTQLTWNGQPVPSTVQSSTQMNITALPVASVQAGPNGLSASLPPPGGGVSASYTVTGYNPVPGTLTITPAQVTAGAGETKVVITGIGLFANSVVNWNGSPRAANFVPASGSITGRFELLLGPGDLAQPSAANIAVSNPAPGGGTSPVARFLVQAQSGTGVPSLTGPTVYRFDDTTPIPATITLTGTGFTASAVAYWDGKPIPSSFVSATQLSVTPPPADLAVIGSHDVFVANGSLQSATIRMQLARTETAPFSNITFTALDPAGRLLYLLIASSNPPRVYDLVVQDTVTGKQTLAVPGIMTSVTAAALSDDGSYLYLAGGTSGTEIRRFNTASHSIDLDWQIPASYQAPSTTIPAIATVTGSPETLIVSSFSQGVSSQLAIYDRDQARQGIINQGLDCCGTQLFATSNRVFVFGSSNFPCLQWFDFDSAGVESFSGTCGLDPPELVHRAGFAWLTDGSRTRFVSAPYGAPAAGNAASNWVIDPANNIAWAFASSIVPQLLRFDLATTQVTTLARPGISPNNIVPTLLLDRDGNLRVLVVPGQLSAP